jgi:hypothetical protein
MINGKFISLEWSGGDFSVIVDWRNGAIMSYSNQEEARRVHIAFGGKNYYISRTGLTGAGWIPNHAMLAKVSTYRTDIANVDVPRKQTWDSKICVPINYTEHNIDYNYPILVNDNCVVFCDSENYYQIIMGEVYPQEVPISLSFIKSVGGHAANLTYPVYVAGKPRNIRKVYCAIEDFRFNWPQTHIESRFWNRLGLYRFPEDPNRVYKISSGICWAKAEVPTSVEELAKLAPKNVYFLELNYYLQRSGEYFDAVGRKLIDREEYDYELSISYQDAVRAIYGKPEAVEKIKREIDHCCWQKYEIDDRRKRQVEEQILYQQERFKDYMDAVVTVQDSIDVGNCEVGTRNFLDKYFPGKEEVTVRDLMPYVLDYGVRRVIEHVAIKQQKQVE